MSTSFQAYWLMLYHLCKQLLSYDKISVKREEELAGKENWSSLFFMPEPRKSSSFHWKELHSLLFYLPPCNQLET